MTENPQKEQIADVFQRHFNHFGFKKTSVDDISAEMKISKKTIYQHFSTKEEIFYYVVNRIAQQYMRSMNQKLEKLDGYQEKLSALIRMIFAEAKKWLKQNDAFEFRYKYEIGELAFKDAYSELLHDLVRHGVESGDFAQSPADFTTKLIQGMISESIRLVTVNPDLDVEGELIEAINKLIRK